MNTDYISRLQKRGFFKKAQDPNEKLYLATPYRVVINADVTKSLRSNYLPTEEKGGLLWAKAKIKGGERILVLEKVSFIRNAIDDTVRDDGLTSANAYLRDSKEYQSVFQELINAEFLPFAFHTHPIIGNSILEQINHRNSNMDTSQADINASERLYAIYGHNVHLPHVLIMGNTLGDELFIRLYGGNNSPASFVEASRETMSENLDSLFSKLEWNKFSTGQKILTGAIAATAFFGTILRPKMAAAIMVAGAPLAFSLITDTHSPSPHYCRLTDEREATILVPNS